MGEELIVDKHWVLQAFVIMWVTACSFSFSDFQINLKRDTEKMKISPFPKVQHGPL